MKSRIPGEDCSAAEDPTRGTIPPLVRLPARGHAVSLSSPALSQSQPHEGKTAEEVAAELANPNTTLGVLGFPIDWSATAAICPERPMRTVSRSNFQPSQPVPLGEGLNFSARPLVPITLRQPVPTGTGFESKAGLGDISFDSAVGKTFKSGLIVVGGVVGSLPTATDDALGTGQFLLGPEALVGWVQKWGALGALVTQSWHVAGGDDEEHANITGGQYFYTFNLKNAWQISAQPTWSWTTTRRRRVTSSHFPSASG